MKNYKKITILITLFSLLIDGCASNNIKIIKQNKQNKIKSKIYISQIQVIKLILIKIII
jgi:starvation-inducible outer membrane lipoprotein